MPSGSKVPETSVYSKYQNGEWGFDTALRGKVQIAAVSAGLAIPVTGGVTAVRVNNTAGASVPVHLTGGTTDQDVRIAAVLAGVTLPVSIDRNASYACTKFTTASGSSMTVLAAQGATTATKVLGCSFFNKSASAREIQLRFGATAFWYGGLGPNGAFNWNYVGHYVQSANNKAVKLYIDGAGTVVTTVYWKKA